MSELDFDSFADIPITGSTLFFADCRTLDIALGWAKACQDVDSRSTIYVSSVMLLVVATLSSNPDRHDKFIKSDTTIGANPMLQGLFVGRLLISRSFAIFILGVIAIVHTWDACADTSTTAARPCFPVFDALLFNNKPDLRSVGLQSATLVAPNRWLNSNEFSGSIPDQSAIQAGLRAINSTPGILVLDEESWPVQGSAAIVGGSVNNYLTLLSRVKLAGIQAPIGYYGAPPIRDYWRAISGPTSQSYRAWQSDNDLLQPVADVVDILFPSIYTFYNDPDGWTRYAIANLSEAHRLGKEKPVYAFLMPQFHESNKTLGLKLIPGNFWASQLQIAATYADGIVIWGGWHLSWDEQADWWQATRQFLRTNPQICSAPNAPADIQVSRP